MELLSMIIAARMIVNTLSAYNACSFCSFLREVNFHIRQHGKNTETKLHL
jgi:hypothetical protein